MQSLPQWQFRVFLGGTTASDGEAYSSILKRLCREHAQSDCSVEIINLQQNPEAGTANAVYVVPTIMRVEPGPVRRLVGAIRNDDSLAVALGLKN